jgi:uncharacterized protein (DUF983 family)
METAARPDAARPLGPALARGLARRCPACGRGGLFDGFLAVRAACPACGEAFAGHRADDAPAWATMLVVGHAMVPLILAARAIEGWPVEAHMALWPLVALGLCLALLPRVKGAIVGWKWACRMHGFGAAPG